MSARSKYRAMKLDQRMADRRAREARSETLCVLPTITVSRDELAEMYPPPEELCSDCPPVSEGDKTRCLPCPRRTP